MPTSRTKAEAMERPEKEDRWEKRGKRLAYYRKVIRIEGLLVTYWDGIDRICVTTLKSFRRWCTGADFIRGAE